MSFLVCDTNDVMEACRKQNNAVKLLEYVNENRLSKLFNDVEICAGSDNFPANRMILSCFSEYFENMFKVEMKEKYQKSVKIKGVDGTSMKTIIEFIYTGTVKINNKKVCDVLAAADYLQVNDLKTCCFDLLDSALSPENCFVAFAIANFYENKMLKKNALKIIDENFDVATTTNGFKNLSTNDLIDWLSNREDNCVEETSLYKALIGWAKHDENNVLAFHQIFKHIDVSKLSRELLDGVVLKEQIVLQSSELWKQFLQEYNNRLKVVEQSMNKQQEQQPTSSNMSKQQEQQFTSNMDSPEKYSDLPVNRQHSCSTILHDHLYNIGGNVSKKQSRVITTKTVWRLNLKACATPTFSSYREKIKKQIKMKTGINFEWDRVCSLNKPRSRMGAACFNEFLVVAGGENLDGCLATAEAYSPSCNTWRQIRPLNQPRSHFALVTCNGCLFAIGGVGAVGMGLFSIECLASIDDEWRLMKQMPLPRKGLAAVNCNGFIYAMGGRAWDDSQSRSSVQKYDPRNDKWSYVQSMNFCRYSCAASVIQGRIVVVGGIDNNSTAVTKIESYDPLFDTWTIIGETEDEFYDHSLIVI